MQVSDHFTARGIAITMDGLERAREVIQEEIDRLSAQMAGLTGVKRKKHWKQREAEEESARTFMNKNGHEPNKSDFKRERRNGSKRSAGTKGFWAKMSAQQRSREMKRRIKVRRANRAQTEREAGRKVHIADPRNPKHEAWLKNLKAARKRTWNAKTPAERQAWKLRMEAGKKKQVAETRSAA